MELKPNLSHLEWDQIKFERLYQCPICESKQYKRVKKVTISGKDFCWVSCSRCRLIFQNPRLTKDSLEKIYSSKNFWEGMNTSESCYNNYNNYIENRKLRRKNAELLVRLIQNKYINNGRLLDIACADGTFVAASSNSGFTAQGIELSSDIVNYARKKSEIDIRSGDFEETDFGDAAYDVITLWDADNIFQDISKAWIKINNLLNPGGLFIMNFFDDMNFQKLTFNQIPQWRQCHALYAPSKNSIKFLAQKTGFKVLTFHMHRKYYTFDRIVEILEGRLTNPNLIQTFKKIVKHIPDICLPVPSFYIAVMTKKVSENS